LIFKAAWWQQDQAALAGDDRLGSDLTGIPWWRVAAVEADQMGGTNSQPWALGGRDGSPPCTTPNAARVVRWLARASAPTTGGGKDVGRGKLISLAVLPGSSRPSRGSTPVAWGCGQWQQTIAHLHSRSHPQLVLHLRCSAYDHLRRDRVPGRPVLGPHLPRRHHRRRVGAAVQGRQGHPRPSDPPRPFPRTGRLRQPPRPRPSQELRHRLGRMATGTLLSPRYRNLTWPIASAGLTGLALLPVRLIPSWC